MSLQQESTETGSRTVSRRRAGTDSITPPGRNGWHAGKELEIRQAEVDKEYKALARRITASDNAATAAFADGIKARWQLGKALVDERGEHKKLPNGRLEEISELTGGTPDREIQKWMEFAELYPTEEKMQTALNTSWSQIKASLTRLSKFAAEQNEHDRTLSGKYDQPEQTKDEKRTDKYAGGGRISKGGRAACNGSAPREKHHSYEVCNPDSDSPYVVCKGCSTVWKHVCVKEEK